MRTTVADVELMILSQSRYACVVRSAVEAFVERLGFDDESCGEVVLAVDEAITNVIRHGYGGEADRPIRVAMSPLKQADRDGVKIEITDECEPVDPAAIRGRDLDDVRPGGLGTNIIGQIMDQVDHQPLDGGRGMRLTMHKFKR